MALDWNTTNSEPTAEELEALAANISDMRYGGTSSELDSTELQSASPAEAAVEQESQVQEPQVSALNFIFDADKPVSGESADSTPQSVGGTSEPLVASEPALTPQPKTSEFAADTSTVAPATPQPEPASKAAPVAEPTATPKPAPLPNPTPTHTAFDKPVDKPVDVQAEIPHAQEAQASENQSAPKKSLLARLNEPIDKDAAIKGVSSLISKRGGGGWPTKQSINLYVHSDKELNPRKIAAIGVITAAFVLAFLKFGIFDQLARVTAKEVELAEAQTQLTQLQSHLVDYDEVREEYEAYNIQTSATDIDVLGALDMVDRVVRPYATVESEQVEENILTLVLSGANLETYGNLVTALSAETQVSGVSVQTADNQSADSTSDVTVTLTVSLYTITQVNTIENLGYNPDEIDGASQDSSAEADDNLVSQTVDNVVTFGGNPSMDVED